MKSINLKWPAAGAAKENFELLGYNYIEKFVIRWSPLGTSLHFSESLLWHSIAVGIFT